MTSDVSAELAVYVHWPYCARICPYCDFNVVRERGREAEKAALVDAIVDDLAGYASQIGPRRLSSIFFGGGTPSLMEPEAIARVVEMARRLWPPAADLEISLEANPTDAESARFADIAAAGVGRLSLGVQSLDDRSLTFLGRNHDARAGRKAIELAAAAFERVSIDLIYALPEQSRAAWNMELDAVVATGCEHISAYELSIEPGAAFSRAVRRGAWRPTSDDLAAELFEATQDILQTAGYDAYEVSNHARGVSARSRHNLTYWSGGDYVGVGPGAHGRLTLGDARLATKAPDSIKSYVTVVRETGLGSSLDRLDRRDAQVERLVMGLRTTAGVPICELWALDISSSKLGELEDFVSIRDGRLIATSSGRLVLDRVSAELVSGRRDE